jgi:hypothetical protein
LNSSANEIFWRYIHERHTIWVEGPSYQSKDRIIAENKFLNTYRELDPGSTYFKEQMGENPSLEKVILGNFSEYSIRFFGAVYYIAL